MSGSTLQQQHPASRTCSGSVRPQSTQFVEVLIRLVHLILVFVVRESSAGVQTAAADDAPRSPEAARVDARHRPAAVVVVVVGLRSTVWNDDVVVVVVTVDVSS